MNEEDKNITIGTAKRWRCKLHGETDAVVQIWTRTKGEHVCCIDCLLDIMSAHGFEPLASVAEKDVGQA